MNINKEHVSELIQRLSEYKNVYLPRENYTVATNSRKVLGNNECFGKGLNYFRGVADNEKVIFSIKVNFDISALGTGTAVENNLVFFYSGSANRAYELLKGNTWTFI